MNLSANITKEVERLNNIIQEKDEKIQHFIQVNKNFDKLLQSYLQKNEKLKQENSNLKQLLEQNKDGLRQLLDQNKILNEKNNVQDQEIQELNQEITTHKKIIKDLEQIIQINTQEIKLKDELNRIIDKEDSNKKIDIPPLQQMLLMEQDISVQNCVLKSQIIDNSPKFDKVFLSQAYNDSIKQFRSQYIQQLDQEFHRYISCIRPNTIQEICNLFESFYIIGFNKEELQNKIEIEQDQNLKYVYCTPFIQYEYKSNSSAQIDQNLLMSLCQSSGNLISFINQIEQFQDDLLLDIIVGQTNEQKLSEKFHICAIKQEQELNFQNQQLIDAYNPQGQLFIICMTIEDFIVLDGQLCKYFKTFCFTTYFPIIEVFQKLLTYLINQQKYLRIEKMKYLEQYEEIDGFNVIEKNIEIFTENIRILNRIKPQPYYYSIEIPLKWHNVKYIDKKNYSKFHFTIPEIDQISIQSNIWCTSIILQILDFDEILLVYFSILLEKKIVFISENKTKLSAAIQYFLHMLKPLNWYYVLVYDLGLSMLNKINDETPMIIGLNLTEYTFYYQLLQLPQKKQDLILIYLDRAKQKIQFQDLITKQTILKNYPDTTQFQILQKYCQVPKINRICYQITEQASNYVQEYLTKLAQISQYYVNILPNRNQIVSERNELNEEMLKTEMLNIHRTCKAFIEQFLLTSMFNEFAKRHYKCQ